MSSSFFSSVMEFLSTPSARRATLTSSSQKTVQMIFLSTPSARRATLTLILTVDGHIISIHALREEGDIGGPYMYIYCEISIHALREEGDQAAAAGIP